MLLGGLRRLKPHRLELQCNNVGIATCDEHMQHVMRVACIIYLIFLTALLLTEDPLRLIGVRSGAPSLLRWVMPAAHLVSFGVLAALALTAHWPLPRWGVVLLMVAYAGVTELVQGLVPLRTPEWADWLQDLAGIGVASVVCWLVAIAVGRRAKLALQAQPCRRDQPARHDERRQSWWN